MGTMPECRESTGMCEAARSAPMQARTESSSAAVLGCALWSMLMPIVPLLLPVSIGIAASALGFAGGIALLHAASR